MATRGKPPEVGAADKNRASTEADCFDDVAATVDAAVEQDLDLVADGVGDGGQGSDRGGGAVEVVARPSTDPGSSFVSSARGTTVERVGLG